MIGMRRRCVFEVYSPAIMKAGWGLLAGIGLLLLPSTGRADEWQFWPQLEVYRRLNESVRLLAIGNTTREVEIGSRSGVAVGAYIDVLAFQRRPVVRFSPDAGKHSRLDLRFGYLRRIDKGGPQDVHENRYMGQFQLRFQPNTRALYFLNRNRFERRDVESRDLSWRYRNRSRLEDNFKWLGQNLALFGMAEFFWDSRSEAWSRGTYTLGSEWSFPEGHTVVELTMNMQDEWATQVQTIWAPGLTLKFFF